MIEKLYIEEIYKNMTDVPNIIRGATNGDLEEIKEALKNDPDCINETDCAHRGGADKDSNLTRTTIPI